MSSALPISRRIISSHTSTGGSKADQSEVQLLTFPGMEGFAMGTVFVLDGGLSADPIVAAGGGEVEANGTVRKDGIIARLVELAPGAESAMHYTESIDICAVLSGTIEGVLQDGQVMQARAGDVCVQCANMHQIRNVGSEPARVFTVAVPCKPDLIDGQELSTKLGGVNLTQWC